MKSRMHNLMGSEFGADNLSHTLRKCDFSCHTRAFQPQSVTVKICNLLLQPMKFTHAICHTQWLRTNSKLAWSIYLDVYVYIYIFLDYLISQLSSFVCLSPS